MHWCPTGSDQCADCVESFVSYAGAAYWHHEGLAGVRVDDVQRLELAPVVGGAELEVDRPDLVRMDRTEPLGVLGAPTATLAAPD